MLVAVSPLGIEPHTPTTAESFANWVQMFTEKMDKIAADSKTKVKVSKGPKKLTGKEIFMLDLALGAEGLMIADECHFIV